MEVRRHCQKGVLHKYGLRKVLYILCYTILLQLIGYDCEWGKCLLWETNRSILFSHFFNLIKPIQAAPHSLREKWAGLPLKRQWCVHSHLTQWARIFRPETFLSRLGTCRKFDELFHYNFESKLKRLLYSSVAPESFKNWGKMSTLAQLLSDGRATRPPQELLELESNFRLWEIEEEVQNWSTTTKAYKRLRVPLKIMLRPCSRRGGTDVGHEFLPPNKFQWVNCESHNNTSLTIAIDAYGRYLEDLQLVLNRRRLGTFFL